MGQKRAWGRGRETNFWWIESAHSFSVSQKRLASMTVTEWSLSMTQRERTMWGRPLSPVGRGTVSFPLSVFLAGQIIQTTYSRLTGQNNKKKINTCTQGIHISINISKTGRDHEVHQTFGDKGEEWRWRFRFQKWGWAIYRESRKREHTRQANSC